MATFKSGNDILNVSAQSKTTLNENVENNTTINVNIADNTYIAIKMNSVKTPEDVVEIEQLTKQNSAIINEFTPEYISKLSQQIVKRLQTLFEKKLQIINIQTSSQNNNDIIESNEDN